MTGFVEFIRKLLGLVLGKMGDQSKAYAALGTAKIMWGSFVSVLIDFLVVAAVVYFLFKRLGIEKLGKN